MRQSFITKLKVICADMFAMATFCTLINMVIEVYVSGLSFSNSVETRIIALPINMLIAIPYAKYRYFILELFSKYGICQLVADTFSYATLLSPVYTAILIFMGDSKLQVIYAVGSNLIVCILTGGFYGLYVDLCRRIIGVKLMVS